jgi:hypothetical protein
MTRINHIPTTQMSPAAKREDVRGFVHGRTTLLVVRTPVNGIRALAGSEAGS